MIRRLGYMAAGGAITMGLVFCAVGGTSNVAGNLVVQDAPGSAPSCSDATSPGELCVEGTIETTGDLEVDGASTLTGAVTASSTFDASGAGSFTGDLLVHSGNIGVNPSGTANGYEGFTLENGNFLMQGAGEYQLFFKRVGTFGTAVDPQFMMGRIIASPPLNLAEYRILYVDGDLNPVERALFSLESSGTLATVRNNDLGSHYEAFKQGGDSVPIFRLNSSPRMGLEFGIGGSTDTDVGIRRREAGILTLDNGQDADGGGVLELIEVAAPGTPAANSAYLYLVDAGGGDQSLIIKFDDGTTDTVSTNVP